ncbi:MAG: SUF system Fe-S cluster assembly regulator [Alphaproteobacteria bacterium]|nr:SUF system Fe-S cluster assembly regulator [Alphaproteobacteria bacterium]
MMKLSKMSDYAVVMMTLMGADPLANHTATTVAEKSGLTVPTVRKLMKMLSKAGLLNSTRGVNGGYTFAKNPNMINVSEIIEAVDGPIAMTTCLDRTQTTCVMDSHCPTKDRWHVINDAVRTALQAVTLGQFIEPTNPLVRVEFDEECKDNACNV